MTNVTHKLAKRRERDAQEYMRNMLGELRNMAKAERCDMLAYLIEMAYVEASDIMRGQRPAREAKKTEVGTDNQRAA